ncbi:hypothetical protein [Mucilaginibacter lacusdianchii]|uniref:hypothetical protein n=1 Tax=Mucilaginibacter lacusdianchii TaxID=2684211 RepID=UPI00131E1187|nr:hypothetical protein [Mucilaginibacter sp. JXJ CY 39]
MNALLKRLGLSHQVQAFFHADELSFDYGGTREIYDEGFHYVPTTAHVWQAGDRYAREVIITSSAMEAVAWFALKKNAYQAGSGLALVSLGNLPSPEQLDWVRRTFPRRRITLVFGNHLLGALTDIRVAGWLQGKNLRLRWQKEKVEISLGPRQTWLEEAHCSLHQVEKAFGLRSGIRTCKPRVHATYLAQLQHDASASRASPAAP